MERDAGRQRPRRPERGSLIDEPARGQDGAATALPEGVRPRGAPVARRVASALLDLLLLGVALGFIYVTELLFASESERQVFAWGWVVVFAPLFFALYHAYGTGATPGQLELRIGLRDTGTGKRAGLGRTIFRAYLGFAFLGSAYFGYVYIGFAFLVLALPAAADFVALLRGRSLRDRITGTTVVEIELEGRAPELAGATIPELAPIFERAPGTRQYLRRGWRLLRARPRLVVGTVAALDAVLLAVAAILSFLIAADLSVEAAIVVFAFVGIVLLAAGVYWTYAALVVGVEDLRVGGPDASVWATLVRASQRANALTAALLILIPLLVLGSYLFFPVLLVGRIALIPPALVLEDSRVLGAFRRSWRLTEGQTMRLFGLYLLSSLVISAVVVASILLVSGAVLVHPTVGALVAIAAASALFVLALAWLGAAWALVYEDARRLHPLEAEA
jgi:hypothetical protein